MDYFKACSDTFLQCPNGYAKSYAKAGYNITDLHAQQVQALYILNNIQHWRGPTSKQVRAFLKEFTKPVRGVL